MQAIVAEREARQRVPTLLADLLGDPSVHLDPERASSPADMVVCDGQGRAWLIEVKATSRPDQIIQAAHQFSGYAGPGIPLLVVPVMSSQGAGAAAGQKLNWMDLAGNARIRTSDLYVRVEGRPQSLKSRGRPNSPFAPKSARVTRALLVDPSKYWRQHELVEVTGLDDGSISRVVRRLDEASLLERHGAVLRPRDPDLLLNAWEQDYRFEAHDVLVGHMSGSGAEVTSQLAAGLRELGVHFAFTGLSAAWRMDGFARYRLTTVYVEGDPRDVAQRLQLRREPRGANVQLVGPNDFGVFMDEQDWGGLPCTAPLQVYLDLRHLPERAGDAADHLRTHLLRWSR